MVGSLLKKTARLVVVLLIVSTGCFFLVDLLPGDPTVAILGPAYTPENAEIVRADLGLDEPVTSRYIEWLSRVTRGDLGVSYLPAGENVADLLRSRMSVTFELILFSQLFALAVGVPAGVVAAHRANRPIDKAITATSFGLIAAPQFAVAILLLLVFSVQLGWFDVVGYVPLTENVFQNLKSMVLPTLTLGLPLGAVYARIVRTDMVVTLTQDHIQLARAIGLPTRRILVRHALRQSSLTLLTVMGLQFGTLLAGTVIVENIFTMPGMGRLLLERIFARDYLVVQGAVLVTATAYVLVNFLADVTHSMLDPRIRHQRAAA